MKPPTKIAYDDKPSLPLWPISTIMLMGALTGVRNGEWLHALWFGAGIGVGALFTLHLFAWRWWRRRRRWEEM